ncbi:MAG: hypothetical protein M1817_005387 [Caeruleum heppii]|nr:MAG: hypothetical protein M1817_005387 [Caeruleum heppii]
MSTKAPSLAQELLAAHHIPAEANRLYTEKVLHKPLILIPTVPLSSTSTSTDARSRRRQARLDKQALKKRKSDRKPHPLSAKQKRQLKIYEIPPEARKWAIYEGLIKLWVRYVQGVLGLSLGERKAQKKAMGTGQEPAEVEKEVRGLPVTKEVASKLCGADFHGAEVTVVRSRCVGRVGITGIVVKDCKFVFEVITRGNEIKVLPKEHSIFRFEVPIPGQEPAEGKNLVFELHGEQFQNRAPDRANKKFKVKNLPDL